MAVVTISSGLSLKVVNTSNRDNFLIKELPLKVVNKIDNSGSLNRLSLRSAGYYEMETGGNTIFYDMSQTIIRKR